MDRLGPKDLEQNRMLYDSTKLNNVDTDRLATMLRALHIVRGVLLDWGRIYQEE